VKLLKELFAGLNYTESFNWQVTNFRLRAVQNIRVITPRIGGIGRPRLKARLTKAKQILKCIWRFKKLLIGVRHSNDEQPLRRWRAAGFAKRIADPFCVSLDYLAEEGTLSNMDKKQ
jgi:hypothetical protein